MLTTRLLCPRLVNGVWVTHHVDGTYGTIFSPEGDSAYVLPSWDDLLEAERTALLKLRAHACEVWEEIPYNFVNVDPIHLIP